VGGGFVPGVRLAGEFYSEVIRPLLEAEFPGLPYAAALIGAGSEVLGFDTERSTDHDWGPRLLVFGDEEAERLGGTIDEMLGRRLPEEFGGYPVAFDVTRDPGRGARHRVEVFGLGGWLAWRLGFDPRGGVTVRDWLAPGGAGLGRHLAAALAAAGWAARERELVLAYRIAAEAHNGLGLTEPLDPGTRPYYDRPQAVLAAGRFATALTATITDPVVRRLGPAGTADQVLDSTPALGDLRYARAVTSVSGI
jgi:hypothetical protein